MTNGGGGGVLKMDACQLLMKI